MLKFKDKTGAVKFLLQDDASQPVDVDQLVLETAKQEELDEKQSAQPKEVTNA